MTTRVRRVMKARSAKRLGCGCVPKIGERIVCLDDGRWTCVSHLIDQVKARAYPAGREQP